MILLVCWSPWVHVYPIFRLYFEKTMLHVENNHCSLYNANFKITHLKKYIELPWFLFSKCDDLVQYLTHHQSALPQPITSSFVKLNLIENWLIWWKKKINIQIHVSSNKLCYLERQSYMYHQFLMKYSTIHRND